jgi:hypothetical protein
MKKFIIRSLVFAFLLFSFFLVVDIYLSNKLKKSHDFQGEIEVWDDIYKGEINSELLIYGSSRAWVHVDPNIIKDTLKIESYNFGMDGQNFWLQYLRHKKFLKYNNPPKKIILCTDVFSFAKNENLYGMNQFLPFMLFDFDIVSYTSKYNGFDIADYFIPLIRYYGKINGNNSVFNTNFNSNQKYRDRGYRGMEKEWNDDFSKAKIKNPNYSINCDFEIVNLFDKFLTDCEKDGIKVYLVNTPEYIEGQKYVTNRKQILNKIEFYSKKHNLPFLNYSDDDICHNKDYFYNSTHLNKKGAEIFSRKLASDLKSLFEK